jgi:hypothetical protein
MKRLSVVLVVIFVLSALLTACGGGGGAASSDPVGVVKAAMQTVVDKKFDALAAMTCAAQKDKVAQGFNPAGALGATGVDATKILDAMTISLQNPEYTKVSEEADKAVVQMKGKLSIKFDKDKLKVIMQDVLKAQGQTVTDEQLTAGLDALAGQMEQGQDLDQKVNVVKENGQWVFCPTN